MAQSSTMGSILKYALLALGAYLVWKTGIIQNLLAQITGTTPAALPPATTAAGGGTATTGGGGSTSTGAGSSGGPQPAPTGGSSGTSTGTTGSSAPPNLTAVAQALDARARADGLVKGTKILPAVSGWPAGQVLYNVFQWNWVYKELNPAAANYSSGANDAAAIPATQYVLQRSLSKTGLSGLGTFVSMVQGRPVVMVPMRRRR
jgi:hypothetical protein